MINIDKRELTLLDFLFAVVWISGGTGLSEPCRVSFKKSGGLRQSLCRPSAGVLVQDDAWPKLTDSTLHLKGTKI